MDDIPTPISEYHATSQPIPINGVSLTHLEESHEGSDADSEGSDFTDDDDSGYQAPGSDWRGASPTPLDDILQQQFCMDGSFPAYIIAPKHAPTTGGGNPFITHSSDSLHHKSPVLTSEFHLETFFNSPWTVRLLLDMVDTVRLFIQKELQLDRSQLNLLDRMIGRFIEEAKGVRAITFKTILEARLDKLLETLLNNEDSIGQDRLQFPPIVAKARELFDIWRSKFRDELCNVIYHRSEATRKKYLKNMKMRLNVKTQEPYWDAKHSPSGADVKGSLGLTVGE